MPKGQFTDADIEQPKPQSGKFTSADIDPAPPQPKGLGSSLSDTLSTIGSHLKNMVMGSYSAVITPPKGVGENVLNLLGPGALPAYRMFAKPSISAATDAAGQAKAGNLYSGDPYDEKGNYKPDAVSSAMDAVPLAGPWARQVDNDAHQKGGVAALAGLATDLAVPKVVEGGMGAAGRFGQKAGPAIINNTVGSLKGDFARGKSPGDGYFQANLGPSASMDSIANKAQSANDAAGQKLGSIYDTGTRRGDLVPMQSGMDAIMKPAVETRGKLTGFGGTGKTSELDSYLDTLQPSLQKANAQGGFTPSDYFEGKKNVAANTDWSEASKVGMKSMRQQTAGAMGGELTNLYPETGPLNELYGNTQALADRAKMRAQTGSFPLSRMLLKGGAATLGGGLGGLFHGPEGALGGAAMGAALDSVPARTTLASSLFYGGRVLQNPALRQGAAAALYAAPKRQP